VQWSVVANNIGHPDWVLSCGVARVGRFCEMPTTKPKRPSNKAYGMRQYACMGAVSWRLPTDAPGCAGRCTPRLRRCSVSR